MKRLLILFIFIPVLCFPQDKFKFSRAYEPKFWVACGSFFLSGMCDASKDVLDHQPQKYADFWNVNIDNVDPGKTWQRKYKNGDPSQGAAYFGSTTFLVWTTDVYHGYQLARNTLACGGLILDIMPPKRYYYTDQYGNLKECKDWHRKWYVIISKGLFQWACFDLGKEAAFQLYKYNK